MKERKILILSAVNEYQNDGECEFVKKVGLYGKYAYSNGKLLPTLVCFVANRHLYFSCVECFGGQESKVNLFKYKMITNDLSDIKYVFNKN
jgi:hypothetical protein